MTEQSFEDHVLSNNHQLQLGNRILNTPSNLRDKKTFTAQSTFKQRPLPKLDKQVIALARLFLLGERAEERKLEHALAAAYLPAGIPTEVAEQVFLLAYHYGYRFGYSCVEDYYVYFAALAIQEQEQDSETP